jgi:hypothetical protein
LDRPLLVSAQSGSGLYLPQHERLSMNSHTGNSSTVHTAAPSASVASDSGYDGGDSSSDLDGSGRRNGRPTEKQSKLRSRYGRGVVHSVADGASTSGTEPATATLFAQVWRAAANPEGYAPKFRGGGYPCGSIGSISGGAMSADREARMVNVGGDRSVSQLLGVALLTVISTSSLLYLGAWAWQSRGSEIQEALADFRSSAIASAKQILAMGPESSGGAEQAARAVARAAPAIPSLVPSISRA